MILFLIKLIIFLRLYHFNIVRNYVRSLAAKQIDKITKDFTKVRIIKK